MSIDQGIVFAALAGALVLFASGRWRYDVVALVVLLALTLAGLVPPDTAFRGFGHPAVVTVAAVLVVSRGLRYAGVVDLISGLMLRVGTNRTAQVLALTALVTVLSAFMNNVGALALLLPVAVQMARANNRSPSFLLMPLAFGSLLGGMTTLIGTPPNIIIAAFRAETGAPPFGMFDFSPVGGGIALGGVAFIALVGWRLVPRRTAETSAHDLFEVNEYAFEVQVSAESPFVGRPLYELEEQAGGNAIVLSLSRGDRRTPAPPGSEPLRANDVLTLEADAKSLRELMEAAKLTLGRGGTHLRDTLGSQDISLVEAVVTPESMLQAKTARALYLRLHYGINVIGVARFGSRVDQPIGHVRFQSGDVLLVQGPADSIFKSLATLGCLPLATRGLRLGEPRRFGIAVGIFVAAVVANALGLVTIHVSFTAAAVLMVLTGLLSIRDAYESIDWPIVVLVGAMIPVGAALESSGGAELVARSLVAGAGNAGPTVMVGIFLVATMFLSDLVNNAAAAIIVAPIAISTAVGLDISADPLLMGVAVGASCAFLTPIGHQSNAMVMAPGGYRFGDYWRVGLPLEILIAALAVPLIVTFWPSR